MFNPFRLVKRIIYLLLLVVIAYGVINYQSLLKQAEYYFYQKYPKAELVRQVIKKEEKPQPVDTTSLETRLIISKINVNVPVIEVADNQEKTIQKGLEQGVVHYPGTAHPGEEGNFFLVGHSSDYLWKAGDYKDVFALLNKLEVGDEASVLFGGEEFFYRVSEKMIVAPEQVEVLKPTSEATLSLMTCWPIGTPLKRLVITAQLVR